MTARSMSCVRSVFQSENQSLYFYVTGETKLPCHITGYRVLYMGGTTAFIHRKTEKNVVEVN